MASVWNQNYFEEFVKFWAGYEPLLPANSFLWANLDRNFYSGAGATCGSGTRAVSWDPSTVNTRLEPFFQFMAGEDTVLLVQSTYFWQSFFQVVLHYEAPSSSVPFYTVLDTTPRSFILKFSEFMDINDNILVSRMS